MWYNRMGISVGVVQIKYHHPLSFTSENIKNEEQDDRERNVET
jgi:CRISPR/Cas system-associated protein Cas10 (large subunit of type III CRISPR-Cas system)